MTLRLLFKFKNGDVFYMDSDVYKLNVDGDFLKMLIDGKLDSKEMNFNGKESRNLSDLLSVEMVFAD